jgi:uncharacterized radical SAM protein YgiQ
VRWRSPESILKEAEQLTHLPGFKGYIQDVGGPTANMYGFECRKKLASGVCEDKRCLFPVTCRALKPDHQPQTDLLKRIRKIPGVKKAFVASGIRYDLVLTDTAHGRDYLHEVVDHHVSGQMKVAPEHTDPGVMAKMGKPGPDSLVQFKHLFDDLSAEAGKKQFLTYYLIAAHPGCGEGEMRELKRFVSQELRITPEQVQIFTPTPSTYSSLMYYTGLDPFTLEPLYVERDPVRKEKQKTMITEPELLRPASTPRRLHPPTQTRPISRRKTR